MKNYFLRKTEGSKKEYHTTRILLVAILSVVLVWAITFVVLSIAKEPGQIGDSFGMVNALFSALAFALLIYTSLLQTQELRLQRQEIEENRKELARSATAQKELVEITKRAYHDKIIPCLRLIKGYINAENSAKVAFKVDGATLMIIELTEVDSSDLPNLPYASSTIVIEQPKWVLDGEETETIAIPLEARFTEDKVYQIAFRTTNHAEYYQRLHISVQGKVDLDENPQIRYSGDMS